MSRFSRHRRYNLILLISCGTWLAGCQQGTVETPHNAANSEQSPGTQDSVRRSVAVEPAPEQSETPISNLAAQRTPASTAVTGSTDFPSVSEPGRLPLLMAPAASRLEEAASAGDSKGVSPTPVQHTPEVLAAFEALTVPFETVEAWEDALQKLLAQGDSIVPLLAEKLRSPNEVERETAASTLVACGPAAQAAIPALVQALEDPSPFIRVNAAVTLVQFPQQADAAIPQLVKLVEHPDPVVRQMASANLAFLGSEATPHVATLARLLESEDGPDVLLPVVELLGRLGPAAEVAVPKLRQIAFEQSGEVRNAAQTALQQIQSVQE